MVTLVWLYLEIIRRTQQASQPQQLGESEQEQGGIGKEIECQSTIILAVERQDHRFML